MQAQWEQGRKDLDKARHDVERLRRALDRSDAEKRDQQHKASAARQALQVCHLPLLQAVSVARNHKQPRNAVGLLL